MSLYYDLAAVLTPYADKIKKNASDIAGIDAYIGGGNKSTGSDIDVTGDVTGFAHMALKTISGTPNMNYSNNTSAKGIAIAFHPSEAAATYTITASGNNRLGIYGTYADLDLQNLAYDAYPTEAIMVSADLTGATFNGGSYATIFIYLSSESATLSSVTYTLVKTSETSRFVIKNRHYSRLINGYIASSNSDGTKNFAFGGGTSAVFNPDANTDYAVDSTNNNRLRVYGTTVHYDEKTVDEGTIIVDVIYESSPLSTCSFNSGDYETIFIYLDNREYNDAITCTVYSTVDSTLTDAVKMLLDNTDSDTASSDEIKLLKYGMIPNIPTDIPLTALEYHACWDSMVESGKVLRSEPTYMSTDSNHIYPLYTYTIKVDNQYLNPDYTISGQSLSAIYERPKILLVSGHHGDEICTPWALLYFVKRMIDDGYYQDMLAKYEWTIVPLVNPTGYNARRRTNSQGKDINRDYNDSNGFATEEAQYVRDVFLSEQFIFSLDLHQAPDEPEETALGFTSMNLKRASESQEDFDKIHDAFCHFAVGAGARIDRDMLNRYNLSSIAQTAYLWDSSNANGNTYKNYVAGNVGNINHKDNAVLFSATLETQTNCKYLSHTTTNYNPVTVQYTNVYANEIIKAMVQTYEKLR